MKEDLNPEIICVGELLVDMISKDYAASLRDATTYERLPGGSPANLAMNLARLGKRVELIATVGQDDMGALLVEGVQAAGVGTNRIGRVALSTTLILVTKSREVSNFEPYRSADRAITEEQFRTIDYTTLKVMHTTAFALAREPERSIILGGLRAAAKEGARASVDFNYADKIWRGDREAGLNALTTIAKLGGLIKVSEVDFERLFGVAVDEPKEAARRIKDLGAAIVCLTLGAQGCYVLTDDEGFHLAADDVEVVDTTGAGDAFWSGFLAAYLEGRPTRACTLAGRAMATRKLSRLGPVLERLTVPELLK